MLVQQLKNVVDDLILRLGEEIRLREGRLRDLRMGVLPA